MDVINNDSVTPDNDNFALDSLEAIRTRLLDLTGRNRLLNFKYGRSGFVRIIDELPNQLAEGILEEKSFMFLPVEEPKKDELIEAGYIGEDEEGREVRLKENPNAREWAKYKGFNVDYELPAETGSNAGNHGDTKIQSLFYPSELESKLRGIRSKANSAIEETGANILYLALGFLEWFEDDNSKTSRLAPLYLIPVKIDKAKLDKESSTYRYTIQYTGEDIVSNLSLREKLRFDFGLDLPELKEDMPPEDYLEQVEHTVLRNKPRWNIRRFGTLSLFDFGRLLMYLDLDPDRWPQNEANIKQHPIIRQFFAKQGEEQSVSSGFNAEYEIDQLPDVHHQYPLIDDADSSQHSALVDAVKGENLVIEGPPGSGKSQTITNLIAAAISQGKKVLFVAEKMAALEVVKSRLERAGLGDFCLELHSHKTQKSQVYQNLAHRISMQDQYRYPKQIDMDIAMYEEKKQELTDYAELVNSEWKQTRQTIHQIFAKATRYRDEFSHVSLKDIAPDNIKGSSCDEMTCRRVVDDLKRYSDVFEQIRKQIGEDAEIEQHPWFGVYNASIQHFDSEEIVTKLSAWQHSLNQMHSALDKLADILGEDISRDLTEINHLVLTANKLPKLSGTENLKALAQINEQQQKQLESFIGLFEQVDAEQESLKALLDEKLLNEVSSLDTAKHTLAEVENRQQDDSVTLSELYKASESIEVFLHNVEAIFKARSILIEQEPSLEAFVPLTLNGIETLSGFVQLVSQLDAQLVGRRTDCFDEDRLDPLLAKLNSSLDRINRLETHLDGAFELNSLPASKTLRDAKKILDEAGIFKWFKSDWKVAKNKVLALSSTVKTSLKQLYPKLDSLIEYAEVVEEINAEDEYQTLLGAQFKGIKTNATELLLIRQWYKSVRAEYGVGFGQKVKLANKLFSMPNDIFKGMQHFSANNLEPHLRAYEAQYKTLSKLNFTIFKDHDIAVSDKEYGLVNQAKAFRVAVKYCQGSASNDPKLADYKVSLGNAQTLITSKQKLKSVGVLLQPTFSPQEIPEISPDSESKLSSLKATLTVAEHLASLPHSGIAAILKNKISTELLTKLQASLESINTHHTQQLEGKVSFAAAVALDEAAWMIPAGGTLPGLIKRNKTAISQPNWLSTWVDFIRVRIELADKGLEKLLRATEKKEILLEELEGIYNYSVFDALSREVINENQVLSHFSGANQNAIRQQFAEYDNRLKELQQEKIAFNASRINLVNGVSSGKVAGYSEMGLINNEVGKKTRHVPIRQLVARAPESLQELKPCFMMGPHSVAQYLQPGKIEFDLVVMDEASQIKPQDSLGTIARGKQIVVVGDPKQLPPTSFFDKTIENDEQDATAIELSESILDVTMPMFKARRLRWHYRSRHESLIAFSNQEFYDNNLIIFPSPNSESDEFGIKFTYVDRGRFVNQRNIEEAQMVAQAVRKHVLHRASESLGVVAMSAQQREQVERCVEELSKDDDQFRAALEKNAVAEEPLFIKNLENVQGDERDVIFISCTYGPQEAGASTMPQRFGPINSAAGGRRLNVLFTRSKKRMHVFSSMTEGHILARDNSNPGVHALKLFLAFAQTKNLYQPTATGKAPDSDFEIAVARALRREGFTCVPQVGVAGYFIDLAVLDPGMPGRYLMGIECDGATYHSAKSARDRDRLRQSVLERLGWNIRRIWSTDWFKNPQAQLKPIIDELHQLKTEQASIPEPVSEEEEIEEILAVEDAVLELSDAYSHEIASLKDKLQHYGEQVINKEMPGISEDAKLLRPSMIDALLEFLPVSKSEFHEFIPGYLRSSTDSRQGKYLDAVLNIIAEDEQESVN